MWLKLSTTNRDPAVILGYFLQCVGDHNGINYVRYTYIIIYFPVRGFRPAYLPVLSHVLTFIQCHT